MVRGVRLGVLSPTMALFLKLSINGGGEKVCFSTLRDRTPTRHVHFVVLTKLGVSSLSKFGLLRKVSVLPGSTTRLVVSRTAD